MLAPRDETGPDCRMDTATQLAALNRADLQKIQQQDLMRALAAKAFASYHGGSPAEHFAAHWPRAFHRDLIERHFDPELQQKGAIAAGSTTDASWAAPLMPPQLVAAFVPLVAERSAVLQLPLRRVPFDTKVSAQTSDASYSWVGETHVKPISKFTFAQTSLTHAKTAGVVVISLELARLAAPGAMPAMQAALVAGLSNFVDQQFLDPAVAAVAGVNPASITNGLVAVTGGTTVAEKIAALVTAFYAGLPQASRTSALVMAPSVAGQLAATGQQPNLTVAGGTAFGLAVVTTPAAGTKVIALDPERVLIAREDAPVLDVSTEGAVQMDSAPTDPPGPSTVLLSFFQMNLVGIRCEWMLTWQATPNSVAYTLVA